MFVLEKSLSTFFYFSLESLSTTMLIHVVLNSVINKQTRKKQELHI